MAIIKVRQVIGISKTSFDDAIRQIIEEEAVKKGKNVTGLKILDQTVSVTDGQIKEYKVNAHIAYKWEER